MCWCVFKVCTEDPHPVGDDPPIKQQYNVLPVTAKAAQQGVRQEQEQESRAAEAKEQGG